MSHELRLTLLGECRIELDGNPVAGLALAKARALLCYLAVAGRPQLRNAVTDLLWGELNEADARRNLRVVLTKLRDAVGGYVLATRSELVFNRSLPHVIDAATFEQGAQRLLASSQAPTPDDTIVLEQRFALYTGDFMRGLEVHNAPAFEEWLRTQREHLLRLALQVGERLADHYETTGQDSEGIAACRRLIELEPWQEGAHRRLILLLARSGQPEAALRQFDLCRRALADELGIEPDAATHALAERIRNDVRDRSAEAALTTASTELPHNLPAPTTAFVGRTEELAQIEALLAESGCRLLTLIGIGGVGKTRLALQVAHSLVASQRDLFRHGVYFVPLAAISTADQIIAAIADAMNFAFSGQEAIKTQVLNHLREKDALLILDNFEHIIGEAALLTELLQVARGVKVLITSRERLNLYEEWLFHVHGLSLPHANDVTSLMQSGAVQLFAQRARRLSTRFNLANEPDVIAGICRLMEGLPLSIELAAGWVRTHTCDEIARAIQRNLDFLSTSARNAPERHRSLRVAFDYSWDMLTHDDAHKLARLAVFRGTFDDAAAEAIAAATRADLERLADKSLVERTSDGRWSIHEMLRQYLAERVGEAEWPGVQMAHSRFFAQFVIQRAPMREAADEPQALAELRREIGNLRAAWEWLIAQVRQKHDLGEISALVNQCVPMLAYFHVRECWYQEGWQVFADAQQAMRDLGGATATLATVESSLAEIAFSLSRYADVVALIEQALPAMREAGDQILIAEALARLGKAHVRMGHYAEAEPVLNESLATFLAANERKGSTAALNWLAALHSNQGQFEKARVCFETCLAIFREHGYKRGIANTLNNLGSNYGRNDQFAEERPLYEEAHRLALEVGERILIAVTLSNLGSNARSLGSLEGSRQYFETSLAHCREMGERRWVAANLNGLALTLIDKGELDAAWNAAQEALQISREIESEPDALDALAALGEVLAKTGQLESATTVLDLVVHHPVAQRMARERSRHIYTHILNRPTREAAARVAPGELELALSSALERMRSGRGVAVMNEAKSPLERKGA
jgi:predicted ATPase/DNA-binding SARP family transcriptional activator